MTIGLIDAKGMDESQIRLSGCPIKGHLGKNQFTITKSGPSEGLKIRGCQ